MSVTQDKCVDCGLCPRPDENAVLLTQSVQFGAKTMHWKICSRCFLRRGAQDAAEMREQLTRSMKTKAKVA